MGSFQINVPLDMDGQKITNGAPGTDPTDFVVVSQLGSGSGITEITSTDLSVTITNPTGPTVDLSVAAVADAVLFNTANSNDYLSIAATGDDGFGRGIYLLANGGELDLECSGFDASVSTTETLYLFGATAVRILDGGTGLSFFGVANASQQANIPDPSGGVVQDAESRTAIASINALLQAYGLEAV